MVNDSGDRGPSQGWNRGWRSEIGGHGALELGWGFSYECVSCVGAVGKDESWVCVRRV